MRIDISHERLNRLNEALQLPVDAGTSDERADQIVDRIIAIKTARTWTPPENNNPSPTTGTGGYRVRGDLYKSPCKLQFGSSRKALS